jgi:hypothetical protein
MKKYFLMVKIILSAFALFYSTTAVAGWTSGQIKSIVITKNNILIFDSGIKNQPPNCQTVPNQWVVDLNTAGGKAIYALILSAQAQGKEVIVVGQNSCAVWPDRETVDHLWIN